MDQILHNSNWEGGPSEAFHFKLEKNDWKDFGWKYLNQCNVKFDIQRTILIFIFTKIGNWKLGLILHFGHLFHLFIIISQNLLP